MLVPDGALASVTFWIAIAVPCVAVIFTTLGLRVSAHPAVCTSTRTWKSLVHPVEESTNRYTANLPLDRLADCPLTVKVGYDHVRLNPASKSPDSLIKDAVAGILPVRFRVTFTAELGTVLNIQSPPASNVQGVVGVVGVVGVPPEAAATVSATGIVASQPVIPTLIEAVKLPETEGVPEITNVPEAPLAK